MLYCILLSKVPFETPLPKLYPYPNLYHSGLKLSIAMGAGLRSRFEGVKDKIRLHGDESQHEQTDQWSNRDLIPLPPSRRTWGKFDLSFYLETCPRSLFAHIAIRLVSLLRFLDIVIAEHRQLADPK